LQESPTGTLKSPLLVAGKSHMKVGDHNYFLSWREPWHKFEVRKYK
jgi:hypothetical protein